MVIIVHVPNFVKLILKDQIERFGSQFLTRSGSKLKNLLFLKHFFIIGEVQNFEP